MNPQQTPWTPAPWQVDSRGVVAHAIRRGGLRRRIATCRNVRAYRDAALDAEDLANARLIAAAPALYEALGCLFAWVDPAGAGRRSAPCTFDEAMEKARAALASSRTDGEGR